MLDRVESNPVYERWQWVTLGNITDFQSPTGVLSFTIPGRTGTIHVSPKSIKANSPSDYEWYGNVIENDSTGDAYFLRTAGKTTASIELAGEDYEIYSTDNDIHLLVQYDVSQLNQYKECGNNSSAPKVLLNTHNEESSIDQPQSCCDHASILILYTPAAKQAVADIEQTANLCVSHFNTAIKNSNITGNATIQLAGTQLYNLIETNILGDDIRTLLFDSAVINLRNTTHADLVVLLTNGPYGGAYGTAANIGPYNAYAYAIVQATAAVSGRETFSHEVGHLYGCRHDTAHDHFGIYEHGYAFTAHNKSYYTTMVHGDYINDSNYRLLNFSNPDVIMHGKHTGAKKYQNNARKISETYPAVISFRSKSSGRLFPGIAGPDTVCCYRQFTYTPYCNCGTAPYTFEWRTSYDGINYGNVAGTSETFTDYVARPAGNYQYVKVTVHSSDGQTATGFLNVYVDKTCIEGVPKNNFAKSLSRLTETVAASLKVQPNPFNQSTSISFKIEKQSKVKLEILNSNGQSIKTILETTLAAGDYKRIFNAANFPKSIYLCKLTVDKFVDSKFMILQ